MLAGKLGLVPGVIEKRLDNLVDCFVLSPDIDALAEDIVDLDIDATIDKGILEVEQPCIAPDDPQLLTAEIVVAEAADAHPALVFYRQFELYEALDEQLVFVRRRYADVPSSLKFCKPL